MKKNYVIIACFLLCVWWFAMGEAPTNLVRRFAGRGKRLSATSLGGNGSTVESIEDVVSQVRSALGREVDEEAVIMARVVSSESPGGTEREKLAILGVLKNDADTHGWSIRYTATVNPGTFGRQDAGRRYSTAGGGVLGSREIHEDDLLLAEQVRAGVAGVAPDGAVKFIHYTGYDRFEDFLTAHPKVALWIESGLIPVFLGGVGSLVVFVQRASLTEDLDTGGYA